MESASSNVHCYICNSRAAVSIRNAVQIFSDQNKLESSEKALSEVIGEIINRPVTKSAIHTHIICKKCYRLFQEYDELQSRIKEIKDDVMQQFTKTLNTNNIQLPAAKPASVPPVIVTGIGRPVPPLVPSSTPIGEEHKVIEIQQMNNQQKPPLLKNTMRVVDMRNVKALPPNVVIKKISLHPKVGENAPLKKVNIVDLSHIKVKKPAELTPPDTEMKFEKAMPKLHKVEAEHDVHVKETKEDLPEDISDVPISEANDIKETKEAVEHVVVQEEPPMEDDEERLSPDGDRCEPAEGEEITHEMDDLEEDEEMGIVETVSDEDFVIGHMEMEDGTILMEQGEDGTIRVVHHPGTIYRHEPNAETEDDPQETIDFEITYNEDSVETTKDAATGDKTDIADKEAENVTYVLEGNLLAFKDMVRQIDKKTFECLVCIKLAENKKEEEGQTEEADEDEQTKDDASKNGFVSEAKVMGQHMRIIHNIRMHICEQCGETFRKRGDLTHHMDDHMLSTKPNETTSHTCEACKIKFDNLKSFKMHIRMQHGPPQMKQYTCHVCNRKFGSRKLLEEHNNIHIGIRPYTCDICKKGFASKYTYQSHKKTHTDRPRPHTCTECGKSFFTMQNLTQHEKTHLGIKEFVCNTCGKAFGTQHNLEVHGVVHTGYKPYVCQICNKAFARRAEIRDHERIHTGERPYACDMCGSTFSQRSNLQSHKRATHFNDKRYKCRTCEKSFKRRRLLEYHIKASHTGERPYRCNTCDASFVYPEHFKKHTKIHSGEKPYKCEVCDKAFNSRDNRNAHRFIHSDKKPYECLDCGAGFMRKPLLYSHMQTQGHLSDTIIVNQPRLTGDIRLGNLDGTIILEDGQEVIIKNIKEEVMGDRGITLSGAGVESQEEDVFADDLGDDLEDDNPKLFMKTNIKTENIVIRDDDDGGGMDGTAKLLVEQGMVVTDEDGDETLTQQIQIIQDDDQNAIIDSEGTMRFFQIRMPNGEKGWVALNSVQEDTT